MHKYSDLIARNMNCKVAFDKKWCKKPRLYHIVSPTIGYEPHPTCSEDDKMA